MTKNAVNEVFHDGGLIIHAIDMRPGEKGLIKNGLVHFESWLGEENKRAYIHTDVRVYAPGPASRGWKATLERLPGKPPVFEYTDPSGKTMQVRFFENEVS